MRAREQEDEPSGFPLTFMRSALVPTGAEAFSSASEKMNVRSNPRPFPPFLLRQSRGS